MSIRCVWRVYRSRRWITRTHGALAAWTKHPAVIATALTLATTPADCGNRSTTQPEGRHGCENSWGPLTAVQFASVAPRVRASLRVTCDQEVLTTFHARIAIDHKDGLFADWYEVDHDYYEQLPGLAKSYTLVAPCRDGSYRARASIVGTFTNGEPYKVQDESSSSHVDCDHPEPIT
ncbi:hypothetical protein [Nonomuraea sp. NPDC049141]|uniref:hypothetical protein n=1 Tax=Nonomuraea sp. NPDC049141 TaxID=3155500 RepID=UPI0033DA7687